MKQAVLTLSVVVTCVSSTCFAVEMPMFGEPKAVSSDSLEISIQDAISIAGKSAEGTVIEAALDVENDSLVYEVEMITGNRSGLKIHIDARNGDIVKISEHEDADQ